MSSSSSSSIPLPSQNHDLLTSIAQILTLYAAQFSVPFNAQAADFDHLFISANYDLKNIQTCLTNYKSSNKQFTSFDAFVSVVKTFSTKPADETMPDVDDQSPSDNEFQFDEASFTKLCENINIKDFEDTLVRSLNKSLIDTELETRWLKQGNAKSKMTERADSLLVEKQKRDKLRKELVKIMKALQVSTYRVAKMQEKGQEDNALLNKVFDNITLKQKQELSRLAKVMFANYQDALGKAGIITDYNEAGDPVYVTGFDQTQLKTFAQAHAIVKADFIAGKTFNGHRFTNEIENYQLPSDQAKKRKMRDRHAGKQDEEAVDRDSAKQQEKEKENKRNSFINRISADFDEISLDEALEAASIRN